MRWRAPLRIRESSKPDVVLVGAVCGTKLFHQEVPDLETVRERGTREHDDAEKAPRRGSLANRAIRKKKFETSPVSGKVLMYAV